MGGINNVNFMNFPPVVLDDLDIDAQWMLSAKMQHISACRKNVASIPTAYDGRKRIFLGKNSPTTYWFPIQDLSLK